MGEEDTISVRSFSLKIVRNLQFYLKFYNGGSKRKHAAAEPCGMIKGWKIHLIHAFIRAGEERKDDINIQS